MMNVKEQVASWSGRRNKDNAEPERETIWASKLRVLGSVGRRQFATLPDGRELKLHGPAMPHELEQAPSDAILVTKLAKAQDGRPRTDTFVGTVVPAGTHEQLSKRKAYRPKKRRAGPVDGLAELRQPASRMPVPLGPDDDTPMDIIRGAMSNRPALLITDGADCPLTVRGLIEVVNQGGANLRHHNGHALADWSAVRRWRALLIAAWPLVSAYLAGTPLGCAYEHKGTVPPADTRDPAGVPVCNGHVGIGELLR